MPLGSIKGSDDKLAQLRRGLTRLGSEGYKTALVVIAGRASGLVRKGFDSGTAPDGSPWKATVRGNPPLQGPTGRLEAEASEVRSGGRGLRVRLSLPYANIHLYGGQAGRNHSVEITARPYLPETDLSRLPPTWRGMVEASVETVLTIFLPPP
jgi:phage gpG-like protein